MKTEMRHWRHWYKPDFWRWWWTTGVQHETKTFVRAAAVTLAAITLGIVGYLSATRMPDDE